jgi:fatty-acyl-CoA synthase
MLGLMQSQQLLISTLIEFADRLHADTEIVSRRVEGDIHRTNYRQLAARSRQVANALDRWTVGTWALATVWPRWPGTATGIWSCISA